MAELSPFLNENPVDRAYALGQYKDIHKSSRGAYTEVYVTLNGRVVHTTGLIRLESLANHESVYKFYRRKRDKVKVRVRYLRNLYGFVYQTSAPVPFSMSTSKRGLSSIPVSGSMSGLPSSLRRAKARAKGFIKSPFVYLPRRTRSTPMRPNPEAITRPFLRTFETSAGGRTQDVVSFNKLYREWSGTRTPGYWLLDRRALPDNPHTARIVDATENRYSWYQVQPASGGYDLRIRPYHEVYTIPDPPVSYVDEAEDKALKKLIERAGQGIQSNMAQNLAQISQLTSLIFGNATTIAKSLRLLRQGNIPGAASVLLAGQKRSKWRGKPGKPSVGKSLASNWLQLQYGWKPLLSDIEGFFKALSALQVPEGSVTRVSSSASSMRQFEQDYPPGNGLIGFENHGLTTFVIRTQTKFTIRFKVASPFTNFMAQTGFTNPINLFWEILPFSFVADWFFPIGSFLEQLHAWDGLTFVGGHRTRFSKIWTDSAISYGGPAVGEPSVTIYLNSSSRREEIRLERIGLTAFPSPVVPTFNLRGLETGVRAQNAIALLVQGFRR